MELPLVNSSKYRAPALEKGLDIMELLAARRQPMTTNQICEALKKSVSELFRMLQVLEERGYIAQSESGDGLELTNKLFSLGMLSPPTINLLARALPHMKTLGRETGQSCHLAIVASGIMVVIARSEAPRKIGFSVQVGFSQPVLRSNSGTLIFAFQTREVQENWRRLYFLGEPEDLITGFLDNAEFAATNGYLQQPSKYAAGIIDISCPIIDDKGIVAALTMPHVSSFDVSDIDSSRVALQKAARAICIDIGG